MTLPGGGGGAPFGSTVDSTGGSIAVSGNLTGSGTLSGVGAGVLSLSGSNSSIGGLIVDSGTLQIPGGSFAVSAEYLGYSGSGSLTQTGGTAFPFGALVLAKAQLLTASTISTEACWRHQVADYRKVPARQYLTSAAARWERPPPGPPLST